MLSRFIESLNETDEVRSLYAFQGTDDDIESVYAFDAKRCPTDWHVLEEKCDCDTFTDYEMNTGDDDSDDVESCDDFEGINKDNEEVNINDALSALNDSLMERINSRLHWVAFAILTYFCLSMATALAKASAHPFWSPAILLASVYFLVFTASLYFYDNTRLTAKAVNSDSNFEVDTLEANETEEDIVSVYAFDGLNDAIPTDIDKSTADVASVYAFDGALDAFEILSHDIDKFADDVASVYAFDDIADNDEMVSSNASEESYSSESSNTFGFTIPNLGKGEQYAYHADSDDGCFDFYNDNVTCVQLVTGESLTLVFDGQNLKTVIHDGKVYTSFDAMPSDVTAILTAAREAIISLVF